VKNRDIVHVQEGQSTEDGKFHVNVVDAWGAAFSTGGSIDGKIFGNCKKIEVMENIIQIYTRGKQCQSLQRNNCTRSVIKTA